ncbi:TonB-dependent receptor [Hellea balneolensis]|uniref:TonB-dependent receptor n=1 Tax=Hellea balneolensis TaxID=287478 RepID=UPI0006853D0B|nr:TonB-dependent receptor [Hellea balneolensis]
MTLPTMAHAQDNTTSVEEDDEIVTTGIRQALKQARDLKREADTAIDSITASDVSALPDLSVAEALARVPGVVAQRFDIENNNGGDFPSPEGGGNLIRGLTLVRSEYNGRDAFSANGGRSLDFGTVPPELIGAVDVYKNTSADLIEGGIGGTINLRTLEPFDQNGTLAQVSADVTYTDLAKKFSPEFSVILGDRWDTGNGEFGLLGSYSNSQLQSELHGFQIGQVVPFNTGNETIGLPGGFQLRTNEVDRQRDSYYIAGQWRDNTGDLQITAKYSLIENDTNSDERTLEFFPDGESWNQFEVASLTTTPFTSSGLPQCQGGNDPTPANPTCEMTQAVTGLYESGVISNNLRDWTGAAGAPFTNLGINQVDKSKTDDISLNIKWRPTDQLFVHLDGHKTSAEFSRERLWGGTRFFSDFELNADLDDPWISLQPTLNNNPNRRAGGGSPTNGVLSDPSNANLLFAADEFQENDGDMYALRGDIEYEFDNDGWFDAIKFGARFADREQVNRQAGLNWAAVAPPWAGGYLPYSEFSGAGTGEVVDFGGFFRGGVVRGGQTQVVFANRDLLQNYDSFVGALAGEETIPSRIDDQRCPDNPFTVYSDWAPLKDNGFDGVDYACRGSVGDVREKVQNYYGRLDFGNEFENGMSIEGNVGVRYTKTDVTGVRSNTFVQIFNDPNNAGQTPIDFSPETVAFFDQEGFEERDADLSSNDYWLPSLNLKWNVSDETLIRFAASKAITRPRIDQLRANQTTVAGLLFVTTDDPTVPQDERILDIRPNQINVFSGNPDLKPIESTNLDVSIEHYFGDDNSLTLSLFSKDIKNNIIYGSETIGTATLDSREVPIIFNGDLNQDEAKIKGLELAYTQFYDELPGILGNLGIQANYTYIDAKTNAPVPEVVEGDPGFDFQRIYRFGVNDFPGLSEHAANIIGIYQDEKLEMRLAYNWRSEYLGSYRDFVTGNPIFQQATGYLDGSAKYDFNDNFQIRLQVANILDEKANAEQQIDADGQRFGRTSFTGDRRIKFGARYKF